MHEGDIVMDKILAINFFLLFKRSLWEELKRLQNTDFSGTL